MLKEYPIDISAAPASLQEDLDANAEAEKRLMEKADEYNGGFEDPECPDAFKEKFAELRQERAEIEATKKRIKAFVEDTDWDGYEIVFREPSTEDALYIQGRSAALAEEAEKRGTKIRDSVFGVSEMLDRCAVDVPGGAPDSLSQLPRRVGEWLLEELNDKTMAGVDADLGNSSPQEALEAYRSSRG
mgnify:CR=1 FL=1